VHDVAFDAQRHEYRIDGRPAPGITRVLRAAGLLDGMAADEGAMRRGEYVHLATELDDRGELDETTVDPAIRPYLEGWRKCRRETGWEILDIETLKGSALGYATKIDRIVRTPKGIAVVNIKTGGVYPHYAIQLAGEALLLDGQDGYGIVGRIGVHLDGDGNYKPIHYTDRNDFKIWRAALTVALWKKEKGIPV
jgi:hypothetical protein